MFVIFARWDYHDLQFLALNIRSDEKLTYYTKFSSLFEISYPYLQGYKWARYI